MFALDRSVANVPIAGAAWLAPTRSFAPLSFRPPSTSINALALPNLPPIQDSACAHAIAAHVTDRTRAPNVLELALLGDAITSAALIRAMQELRLDPHNGKQTKIISKLKSNVTYSYIAVAYRLVTSADARRRCYAQKHYADLFEAYIGALSREGYPDIDGLLRNVFSPLVFPILQRWQDNQNDRNGLGYAAAAVLQTHSSTIASSDPPYRHQGTNQPKALPHFPEAATAFSAGAGRASGLGTHGNTLNMPHGASADRRASQLSAHISGTSLDPPLFNDPQIFIDVNGNPYQSHTPHSGPSATDHRRDRSAHAKGQAKASAFVRAKARGTARTGKKKSSSTGAGIRAQLSPMARDRLKRANPAARAPTRLREPVDSSTARPSSTAYVTGALDPSVYTNTTALSKHDRTGEIDQPIIIDTDEDVGDLRFEMIVDEDGLPISTMRGPNFRLSSDGNPARRRKDAAPPLEHRASYDVSPENLQITRPVPLGTAIRPHAKPIISIDLTGDDSDEEPAPAHGPMATSAALEDNLLSDIEIFERMDDASTHAATSARPPPLPRSRWAYEL